MSLLVEYHIYCDRHHHENDPSVFGDTELEARENAYTAGWIIVDGHDICDDCRRYILRTEREAKEAAERIRSKEIEAILLKKRAQLEHSEAIHNEYIAQLHDSD